MNIGENIRKLREDKKMTQSELAEKLGVSRPMVCQMERGSRTPSLPMSLELTKIFGCSLYDIAGETQRRRG